MASRCRPVSFAKAAVSGPCGEDARQEFVGYLDAEALAQEVELTVVLLAECVAGVNGHLGFGV